MKYLTSIIILFFSFFTGCESDDIVNPWLNKKSSMDLTEIRVDLQNGFAGKHSLVIINDEIYYNSILSDKIMLAGPEATFTTYLPYGSNTITVFTRSLNEHSEFIDSSRIFLGDKEKYFIGLQIYDSLRCVVQDSSFLYM